MNPKTVTGSIFVVSAPSGAGKTTLVNRVVKDIGEIYQASRIVTYTTRKPRDNELNGKDYYFLTLDEFKAKEAEHFFLEVTQFNNNYYGSPAYPINDIKLGKSFIFITDMPGAYSIKKLIPQAYLIWIVPPSLEILRKRIMRRKGVKTEEVEQRLVIAQQEISTEVHAKFFDYHLINDELEVAIENLKQLMISVMLR